MRLGVVVAMASLAVFCCGLTGCGEKKTAGEPPVQLGPAPGEKAPVETAPAPEAASRPVPPPEATTPAGTETAKTTEANKTTPTTAAKPKTYTVQKGDTLSEIARRFYGNTSKWKDIYNANKAKISDPDKVKIGTVLTLP